MKPTKVIGVFLLLFGLQLARAGEPASLQSAVPPPNLNDMRFDQRLDQQVPLDVALTDETGKSVKLGQYFTDKPVVLVLAYYRCPMLCGLVLNSVAKGLSEDPLTMGKDYEVLTVSFDPREGPDLAAKKKQTFVEHYKQIDVAEGWHFMTAREAASKRLADAVGFHYFYDAKNDVYNHSAGITILTPSGRISHYLFGIDYAPRDLRLALVDASASKIGSPTDQILLYCFHYDPSTGKYTANVLRFVQAGGVLTLVAVGCFVWIVARRHRREPKA